MAAGSSDADDASGEPGLLDRLRAWERRTGQPIRIVTTGIVGLLTAVVLCFPFGLSVIEPGTGGAPLKSGLVYEMLNTAGEYPFASVNAYNPWALASLNGSGVAANGGWACDVVILTPAPAKCPEAVMFGPFPAVTVGGALLLAAIGLISLAVAWRPTRLAVLTGLALLAIAFFVLPTRVHERYLFPFFAIGAVLAAISIRWRIAYVALSITTFLNMYVVLTTLYQGTGVADWFAIGGTIRETSTVTLIALTTLVAALWAFAQLRPGAQAGLQRELAARSDDEAWSEDDEPAFAERPRAADRWAPDTAWDDEAGPRLAAPAAATTRSGLATGAGSSAIAAAAPALLPTWTEPASFGELGPIGWFRDRIRQRPVRADRSRGLHGEQGGRLDKLDLWVLVVLVAAILGVRMFRLSEPYQMHFDEVYHARTATEFLQSWRYGIDHDIYEWTHPHLAKYAMAGGLIAWGDDRVNATSDLGVPVLDAVVEKRTDDVGNGGGRLGDRVDVVTGSELRSYDLLTRAQVASVRIAGAAALAVDTTNDQLFVGGSDGTIWTFDLASLDAVRSLGSAALTAEPVEFGHVTGSIKRLYAPSDASSLLVVTSDDLVTTLDSSTAAVLGTAQLHGVADLGPAGSTQALVGAAGAVANPKVAASVIAGLLGGSASTYAERLAATADRTVIGAIPGSSVQTKVQAAIDDGKLAGLSIVSVPRVGIADANGLELLDSGSGSLTGTIDVGGAAHGLAQVSVDDSKVYVSTDPEAGSDAKGRIAFVAVSGDLAKNGPLVVDSMAMPGPVGRVAYDDASEMVHVLGRTPTGDAATIYVIEPHAHAVYADAKLPIEPTTWAIDVNRPYPTDDRQQILVFDGSGATASVDVGMHEFAWRLPGVLSGTAMAAFLYLLARILFRRRIIGLLVGVMCFADGMLFVQSRIGMNDAYVGLGIVAAYTLFAALWTGAWRHRGAFWVAMPLIGAFLGLALASKWVALYAIVGMGFLVLVRSALGRFLAVAALVVMTAVLGYLAINVPTGTGFGNLPFVAIMVALTVLAVVANVLHPMRWSLDEIRFAVGAPVALGGLVALAAIALGKAATPLKLSSAVFTPIELAMALAVAGGVVYVLFVAAARLGFGPLAAAPGPDHPAALLPPPTPAPAAAWLRPGAQLGLPIAWMVVCLLALPVAIYVAAYVPWALIDNHVLLGNWPPGHTGQTLIDLTGAMYNYHNGLTAPHAASSPWWAWLFDFKPVWFYQESFAGNTTAAIYDAGNLVIWWLGLPALGFAAWQAFQRRSLALTLITVGYAFQWVSWARIDRAAFQYHYYTSLPFLILALAYFLAELWHGASWRTWLLARLAAAVAILGPALVWVLDRPLCGFVNVLKANPGSQACPPVIPQFLLTTQTAALAAIVGVSVLIVIRLFGRLGNEVAEGGGTRRIGGLELSGSTVTLFWLGLTAVGAIVASGLAQALFGDSPLISLDRIPVEPVAIVLGLPALAIAAFVATARDARRFVVGAVVAIVGWFVVVYPNFSALPLPTAIANVYQGVLPTYLYAFQFPVNNVAATVKPELFGPVPLLLGGALVFLAVVVGYSAWIWRLALAEREADERDGAELGPGVAGGGVPGGGVPGAGGA